MLAHELRTPVTSLGLSVELMRPEAMSLSEAGQTAFLRVVDDSVRLRRLVEKSREYLSIESDVTTEKVDVEAVIREACADLDVEIAIEEKSGEIDTNRFWLGVGIRNLVENAVHHGKPPVTVTWAKRSGQWELSITDHGSWSHLQYKEMKRDFAKGNASRGSGMGLGIALRAFEKLGSSVLFSDNPTCFTIKFR